jgi:hypothetical protein
MLYHGTTLRKARRILKEGFSCTEVKVWHPSEDGVYFWSPKRLTEIGECEEEDSEWSAISRAYSNAQIPLSMEIRDCQAVVFGVDIPDDEVEDDHSCEHMDGAVVYDGDIPASWIKSVHISPDLSLLRGFLISGARTLEMFAGEFSDNELAVAEVFADKYFEIDSDFPLDEVPIDAILASPKEQNNEKV